MTRLRAGGLTLALLLAAAACGDDDPTSIIEGDPLTEAEAEALAEVVAGTLFQTYEQAGPTTAPARASGTFQVNDSFPCEFGGTVGVSGDLTFNINDQTGDGTINFNVTQNHTNCSVQSQSDILFTLNGAPNVTSNFSIVTEADFLSFDGAFDGAVAWQTGEKSGTCSLSVDFSLDGNLVQETGSATLMGTVCGVTFDHSLTLT